MKDLHAQNSLVKAERVLLQFRRRIVCRRWRRCIRSRRRRLADLVDDAFLNVVEGELVAQHVDEVV